MEISDEVKILTLFGTLTFRKIFSLKTDLSVYSTTIHNLHKGNNLLVSYGERLDTKRHSAVATTYLFLKIQETRFFEFFVKLQFTTRKVDLRYFFFDIEKKYICTMHMRNIIFQYIKKCAIIYSRSCLDLR